MQLLHVLLPVVLLGERMAAEVAQKVTHLLVLDLDVVFQIV